MRILRRIYFSLATLLVSLLVVVSIDLLWLSVTVGGDYDFSYRFLKLYQLQRLLPIAICVAAMFLTIRWFWRQPISSIAFINKPHEDAIDAVLRLLRARARALVWASIVCGILILAVVAWCLVRFSTADLAASRVDVDREIYRLRERREFLFEQLMETKGKLEEIANGRRNNNEFNLLKFREEQLTKELEAPSMSATELRATQPEDTRVLVFSITNKLGGVLILLFVVKLLISLYRYNTRLSAFYNSRADAIQLSAGDKALDLKSLSDLLFPSRIDYSDKIRTPAEDVLDRAKDIVVAARPRP